MMTPDKEETSLHKAGYVVNDFNRIFVREKASQEGDSSSGTNDLNVDKALSETLNEMSLEERTQGIHELHGVADGLEETPEMLQKKLEEMTHIAQYSLSPASTAAYRLALRMDKEYYVEGIKLVSLRADKYDTQKAAKRMTAFFSYKQELFGNGKLARDIALDDFQGEDRVGLNSGIFQLLQERDRAGRAIIMFMGSAASESTPITIFRCLYYVFMNALRDIETQKKGLVFILYTMGSQKFHREGPAKFAQSLACIPMRIVAVHCCYNSKLMHLAITLFCLAMEKHLACRFRGHLGTYMECMYVLMTFGIPKHVLPIKMEDGEIDLRLHHAWLETLQARERATRRVGGPRAVSPAGEAIAVPGPMDIIVSSRYRDRSSPGYVRMRNFIEMERSEYEKADKAGKTEISKSVLKQSHEAGCRFLKWTPEGLFECSDAYAREKISHTFRNMRRRTTRTTTDSRGTGTKKRDRSAPAPLA